jgi:hypothetical protein
MIDTSKLSGDVQMNLAESELSPEVVRHMSASQCFEAWLRYEGIIGYGSRIERALDSIRAAEVKLNREAP